MDLDKMLQRGYRFMKGRRQVGKGFKIRPGKSKQSALSINPPPSLTSIHVALLAHAPSHPPTPTHLADAQYFFMVYQ